MGQVEPKILLRHNGPAQNLKAKFYFLPMFHFRKNNILLFLEPTYQLILPKKIHSSSKQFFLSDACMDIYNLGTQIRPRAISAVRSNDQRLRFTVTVHTAHWHTSTVISPQRMNSFGPHDLDLAVDICDCLSAVTPLTAEEPRHKRGIEGTLRFSTPKVVQFFL